MVSRVAFALFMVAQVPLVAWATPEADAYERARSVYYELKGEPARQRYRHHWERVINAFLGVAEHFPDTAEAARALYTAASLTHDLYDISRRRGDLDLAVERYRRVADKFRTSSLADDALYQASTLLERAGELAAMGQTLRRMLAEFPEGDMVARANRLLERVGDELPALAPSPRSTPEQAASGGLSSPTKVAAHRVVLDAGHGGRDDGATGQGGLKEKHVNLEVTKRVQKLLEARGIEVIMTRDRDMNVSLDDRAARASETHADLMVSVHANAAPAPSVHGIETYYLDVSHSRYAKRLAARENADSPSAPDEMKLILADLATKVSTRESKALATDIQRRMVGAVRRIHPGVRDLGAKAAMLHVLLGARCPAILVETAFVSNPKEAELLRRADYQSAVAEAIASGIVAHLTGSVLASAYP